MIYKPIRIFYKNYVDKIWYGINDFVVYITALLQGENF